MPFASVAILSRACPPATLTSVGGQPSPRPLRPPEVGSCHALEMPAPNTNKEVAGVCVTRRGRPRLVALDELLGP